MSIARTILVFLIALSVALLPAAAGAGLSSKSADTIEMSSMEDMDCCPHQANPCDRMGGCTSMATCALHCFNFAASGVPLPVVDLLMPADNTIVRDREIQL